MTVRGNRRENSKLLVLCSVLNLKGRGSEAWARPLLSVTLAGPEPGVSSLRCPCRGKVEGVFVEITLFRGPFNLSPMMLLYVQCYVP